MAHRYGPWHDWFAWYPVNTDDYGWRWLQTLHRRKCRTGHEVVGYFVQYGERWEYAAKGN